jgi:hypothetical protein
MNFNSFNLIKYDESDNDSDDDSDDEFDKFCINSINKINDIHNDNIINRIYINNKLFFPKCDKSLKSLCDYIKRILKNNFSFNMFIGFNKLYKLSIMPTLDIVKEKLLSGIYSIQLNIDKYKSRKKNYNELNIMLKNLLLNTSIKFCFDQIQPNNIFLFNIIFINIESFDHFSNFILCIIKNIKITKIDYKNLCWTINK